MKRVRLFILFFSVPVFSQIMDFELRDLNGDYQTLLSLKGEKLTVIDFWATWCAPCVRSLPVLNDLYARYEASGVGFIGINQDGPRNFSKVRPFVEAMQIKYPVLADLDQEMAAQFQVNSLPVLFIVNGQNRIVWSHSGFRPGDETLLIRTLDRLLSGRE